MKTIIKHILLAAVVAFGITACNDDSAKEPSKEETHYHGDGHDHSGEDLEHHKGDGHDHK